jgi:gluconolactonase
MKTIGTIEVIDPAFSQLLAPGAAIEVLGEGFTWTEGPVWVKSGGYLLFSDIPPNKMMKWDPQNGVSLFRERVGYTGKEKFTGKEPGTNGLTVDRQGRVVACCHGDRCIKRIEPDGSLTVLADKYDGKRLNSPNDLVHKSNGDLYFTDPPYGLPQGEQDPGRELDWFGVYRLSPDGQVTLLTKEFVRPNGLAFSPDEKILYVGQSGSVEPGWRAFPVNEDGTLGPGKVFFDPAPWVQEKRPGSPDGMKVDQQGNLWATGPGGVYCFSPDGKVLGRLNTGERTGNCAFGEDGSSLFICAHSYLCRVRLTVKGVGF